MNQNDDDWTFYNKENNRKELKIFKSFDKENRTIHFRETNTFFDLVWSSYLVYKSETIANRLYISSNSKKSFITVGESNKTIPLNTPSYSYRLDSMDSIESCVKKLNEGDVKETLHRENQEKWNSINSKNYTFELTKSCFCPQEEVKEIMVENGNLVSAKFIPSNTKIDLSKRGDIYSLDGFFGLIQDAFDSKASKVTVTYDETKGYPTDIYIDQNEMIADEEISYHVKNFKVLDALEPTICTLEYTPICAKVVVECITTPCESIEQTFSNSCHLNANKRATFLHMGECE